MAEEKRIVLTGDAAPVFFGAWRMGEIRAALQQALAWLDGLPLVVQPMPADERMVEDGGNKRDRTGAAGPGKQ